MEVMSLETRDARSQALKEGGRAICPRTFAMKAEYRRSAVYVLAAMLLIPLIGWWLRDLMPARDPKPSWVLLGLWSVMALGPLGVLRWRMRVDEFGISRRWFVRWDLWSWQAFEEGRVLDVEDSSSTFLLPEKGPWARKLTIGLIEEPECEQVLAMIDRVRTRSDLTLPQDLRLRCGLRQHVFIEPGSFLVRYRGEETRYAWNDVKILRIRRRDRRRRDFNTLDLVLPDRIIRFTVRHQQGQTIRSWSGFDGAATPSAEVLAAMLERCIASDRVQVTALDQAPLTIAEWEDQRLTLARQGYELKLFLRVIAAVGAVLSAWILVELYRDFSSGIRLLIMSHVLVLIWAVAYAFERNHRRAVAELDSHVPEH